MEMTIKKNYRQKVYYELPFCMSVYNDASYINAIRKISDEKRKSIHNTNTIRNISSSSSFFYATYIYISSE